MPDRVQDLTNHRKVAQASKNYTDQKAEEILWQLAENDVSTSDDNTTASTKTVPSNATRCKIKRIYGNSVKYAPSTASDDSVSKIKSIPLSTFTMGLDYVGGYSEKSENLIVLEDVSNTQQQVTYTLDSATGTITLNGTATGTFNTQSMSLTQEIPANTPLTLFMKGQSNAGIRLYFFYNTTYIDYYSMNANDRIVNFTKTSPINRIYVEIQSGAVFNNQTFQPMLVLGTYASLDFKVGYNGIRSAKTTSVVFSGNKFNPSNNTWVGGYHTASGGYLGNFNTGIRETEHIEVKPNTTYGIRFNLLLGNTTTNQKLHFICCYDSDGNFISRLSIGGDLTESSNNGLNAGTFTTPTNTAYVEFSLYAGTISGDYTAFFDGCITEFMIIESSTAPSTYKPYVAPIQKAIPQEVLELDLCKSAGSVYDLIDLVNKKGNQKVRQVVLNGTENWAISDTNDVETKGRYFYLALDNCYQVSSGSEVSEITATYFNAGSPNSIYGGASDKPYISYWSSVQRINVYDRNTIAFMTLVEFKQWLATRYANGNPIVVNYRLATPIETDISAYLPSGFNNIATNDNYTDVEFVNEYDYDMPNKISFYGTIKETLCTAIEQRRNGTLIKTITLPSETSDGWSAGSVANVRDFTTNERIPNVDKLNNLGDSSLNIVLRTNYDNPIFALAIPNIKQFASAMPSVNLLTPNYKTTNVIGITLFASSASDLSIALRTNSNEILFKDYKFNSVGNLKENLNGKPLYYEKASATPTSLDSIENIIEVEAGDTLTFVNSENQPVPSDITYRIEVAR